MAGTSESIVHGNDKLGDVPEWNAVEVPDDELVEDKYQGTAADRHDMRMLGRIQVLRVRRRTRTSLALLSKLMISSNSATSASFLSSASALSSSVHGNYCSRA